MGKGEAEGRAGQGRLGRLTTVGKGEAEGRAGHGRRQANHGGEGRGGGRYRAGRGGGEK